MRTLLKLVVGLLAAPLVLALLGVTAGLFLPREHQVTRVLHLKAAPEVVWGLIGDPAKDPTWRPELEACVRRPDRGGRPVWEDRFRNGQRIAYLTETAEPPVRLVRTIVDQERFGGTWTYALQAEGTGTRLRITETGWVGVPFRLLAKAVIGHATTLELYQRALARHLGEAAEPQAE